MRTLSALPASLLSLVATLVLPPAAFADELGIDTTRLVTCSRPTKAGDSILVHYNGTLQSDGSTFDSSYNRGTPLGFVLGAGQVIQGWDQGLLHMCPGEIRTLTIPPELAYGDRGAPPVIPPGATLVFETELMSIKDAVQWKISTVIPVSSTTVQATQTTGDFVIATVPNTPSPKETDAEKEIDAIPTLEGKPLKAPSGDIKAAAQEGECHLLGPFALFVQAALGVVALLSLVVKRWRETPKRPWTVWFFDVSKQVIGAMLVHVLNLMMSMFGNGVDLKNAAQHAVDNDEDGVVAAASIGGGRARPNPCSFYLLNLAIDTTIGIPILYLLLKILHVAFSYTPLARPPQSIKTGHYGQPPKATWWLKQSLIYFIGLTGMKLFVLSLFALLPWLPWVGDWALRWTEGNEAVQIAFTMFIFPLLMNGLQYWIIDSFIKESGKTQKGDDGAGEYERVRSRDGDEDDDTVDDEETLVVDESDEGSGSKDAKATLKEVNPTPLPDYDRGEGSRTVSPKAEDEAWS